MSGVDEELVRKINEALITSGERDRLKQLVREKLTKAGWYDSVRVEADSIQRGGLTKILGVVKARNVDSITPQELSTVLYPKASDLIPTHVRSELEGEIRQFLDAHIRIA